MTTNTISPGDVFTLPVSKTESMRIRADHSPDDGIFWYCAKLGASSGDTLMLVPACDLYNLEREEPGRIS